tara:strand:- start:1329 stop:1706 length:378 start_codon:yes stop_codon:yes gene_type:complete
MKTKLYYRQCDCCKSGMSKGYIYHGGDLYFCNDECVGKYFGDKKSFTTLEDWNNNGPGLTWKEFQDSWDELDDNSYEYDWQLDICSYTEWTDGCEGIEVFDQQGNEHNFDDIEDGDYELVSGDDQ